MTKKKVILKNYYLHNYPYQLRIDKTKIRNETLDLDKLGKTYVVKYSRFPFCCLVSKGKKIHIDPCAEEDWSDGDQEKKPSKRKTSNFAEPSKSKTHENSKKEESPRTFEHLKPDDSKADSESEALTLTVINFYKK